MAAVLVSKSIGELAVGMKTYVSNIDELAHFSPRCGVVSEGVWYRSGSAWRSSLIETASRWTTITTSTSTSVATASAVTSSKATPSTTKATSKPSTSHAWKSATTLVATPGWTSKSVLAYLEHAALPVIAVELTDGITRVLGTLECNNTRAFGATIWA